MNTHVLSASDAHVSEVDIKELFIANWMLMKLKEEITVILMIKLLFIWIVKNQSIRDQIT